LTVVGIAIATSRVAADAVDAPTGQALGVEITGFTVGLLGGEHVNRARALSHVVVEIRSHQGTMAIQGYSYAKSLICARVFC